jgi:WD40 repeat protein
MAWDGKTLASSSFEDRNVIHLWDAATGKLKGSLRGHESYLRAVQFAADGRLVSGGGDSTLRVWDIAAGKEVYQFKLHEPRAGEKPLQVATMGVSRDGRILAASAIGFEGPGGETVHVFAWNLANGKLLALREQRALPRIVV